MVNEINWILKKFDALSPPELYAILQLRNEVFVVEQNCVFQDADNKDPACWHFMGWKNNLLVAYTRIVPPGIAYDLVSIGRVVTAPVARGGGLGRELMEQTIRQVNHLFGMVPIQVGAQVYLTHFYTSLGFQQSSAVYLEDGIEHMEMIRPA
jgi:ElaA protein